MRRPHAILAAAALSIAALSFAACSNDSSSGNAPSAPSLADATHAGQQPSDIVWGPAPAILPPGAEIAVLQGDRTKPEPFTIRLRFPNGYRIPPHMHPTTENVTVLTGTFLKGLGTEFVESNLQPLMRGDFASIPPNHPHYVMTRGETVVQVHGVGPFSLTYVDPADNPTNH